MTRLFLLNEAPKPGRVDSIWMEYFYQFQGKTTKSRPKQETHLEENQKESWNILVGTVEQQLELDVNEIVLVNSLFNKYRRHLMHPCAHLTAALLCIIIWRFNA